MDSVRFGRLPIQGAAGPPGAAPRPRRRGWRCLACAGLATLTALPAGAVQVEGRLTTLAQSRERYEQGSDGKDLDLYQFGTLNAYDLLGRRRLSLHLDGFGVVDLRGQPREEDRDAELTSAFLQWQDRGRGLFLRAGRQYVRVGVTSDRLDGVYGDYLSPFHVGLQAFGGKPVNSDVSGDSGDYQWGSRLYLRYPRFEVGVSAMEMRDDDQVGFVQVGGDGWFQVADTIAVSGHGYYDRVNQEWYDFQGLVTWDVSSKLVLSADGRRVIPNLFLSHTSIFGSEIFSTGEQREYGARADYRANRHLSLAAYARYYDYSEGDQDQWTGGAEARYRWGAILENLVGAAYDFQEDLWTGRLFGRFTHRLPRVTNYPDVRDLFGSFDLIYDSYDQEIFPGDGRDYSYAAILTGGVDVGDHWQLTLGLDYGSRPDYRDTKTVPLDDGEVTVPLTRNSGLGYRNDLDVTVKLVYNIF